MDINEKYLRQSKRTASRIYGNTAVVLLLNKGNNRKANRLFALDPAPTFVWRLIERPLKIKLLTAKIIKEKKFFLGKKKAMLLIRGLLKSEIVEIIDNPEEAFR